MKTRQQHLRSGGTKRESSWNGGGEGERVLGKVRTVRHRSWHEWGRGGMYAGGDRGKKERSTYDVRLQQQTRTKNVGRGAAGNSRLLSMGQELERV